MPTIPYFPTPLDVPMPQVPALDREKRPTMDARGVLAGMERLGEAAQQRPVDERPFVEAAGAMGHTVGQALMESGHLFSVLAKKAKLENERTALLELNAKMKDAGTQVLAHQQQNQTDVKSWQPAFQRIAKGVRQSVEKDDCLSAEGRQEVGALLGKWERTTGIRMEGRAQRQIFQNSQNAIVQSVRADYENRSPEDAQAKLMGGVQGGVMSMEMAATEMLRGEERIQSIQESEWAQQRDVHRRADPRSYLELLDAPESEQPAYMQGRTPGEIKADRERIPGLIAQNRASVIGEIADEMQTGGLISTAQFERRLASLQYDSGGYLTLADMEALKRKVSGATMNDPMAFVKAKARLADFDLGRDGEKGAADFMSDIRLNFAGEHEQHLVSGLEKQVKATGEWRRWMRCSRRRRRYSRKSMIICSAAPLETGVRLLRACIRMRPAAGSCVPPCPENRTTSP
jgi:hypothetical protein